MPALIGAWYRLRSTTDWCLVPTSVPTSFWYRLRWLIGRVVPDRSSSARTDSSVEWYQVPIRTLPVRTSTESAWHQLSTLAVVARKTTGVPGKPLVPYRPLQLATDAVGAELVVRDHLEICSVFARAVSVFSAGLDLVYQCCPENTHKLLFRPCWKTLPISFTPM